MIHKIPSEETLEERFFSSFPPPGLLDIKATGVDISDSSIKILGLKQTGKGKVPDFFEERKIAPGIVREGGIEDAQSLATILTALRRKHAMNFVRVALPEEKAYLFQTSVPKTSDTDQLYTSIEFKLEEHVPIPPSESVFDYDIIQEKNNMIDVSVTVFPKSVIENYQKVFTSAGLTPVSFTLEGQAIANAVVSKKDTNTYMIVDFGRTRSGIAIVRNGIVSFSSTVDVGGDELTEAIMKYFKVDEVEAQKIKNEKGFINNKENEELYTSLMSTLSALKDEINRHFMYWNEKDSNQNKENKIQKIILCGGNASLVGLPEFLSAGIKAPVEKAQVWQNAFSYDDYIPEIPYEVSLSYATVVGLALS
ncbi:MAG: type IV pilus assembly protein PilM [Candidatus Paceibacterota bacterium]